MRFRLPAALAPRRPDGAPPLAAHAADELRGVALAQQRVTQQTLRWEKKLLDRRTNHAARAAPRLA